MPVSSSKFSEVLVSLSAKTERELTRLQFENNISKSARFEYTAPIFVKGKWVTWYSSDLMLDPDFEEFRL